MGINCLDAQIERAPITLKKQFILRLNAPNSMSYQLPFQFTFIEIESTDN